MANEIFVGATTKTATPNYQLYVTNGQSGTGTKQLTTGGPAAGTQPGDFVQGGALTYFVATDASGAVEVYDTDGTNVTRLDPNPNSASDSYSSAFYLTPFTTPSGTVAVAFIGNVGTAAKPVYQLFSTNGGNGTGTKQLTTGGGTNGVQPSSLTAAGGLLYFTAVDAAGNTQLWSTDGTNVTRLDPNPNSASDSYTGAYYLTPFTQASGSSAVAFVANVGTAAAANYQLFVTTGTAGSGTKAITTGGASFGTLPSNLTVSGSTVYFIANDSSGNSEVWATNGTTVTRLDPNPNSASDSYTGPSYLTAFTTASGVAELAFVANSGTAAVPSYQLYVTNGTSGSGTKAITTGGASFGTLPSNLTVSGNTVYFTATDSAKNTQVWATDGTTVARLDPNPNSASDSYTNATYLTPFTTAAGTPELAFVANSGTAAAPVYQLYVTNGAAGTGTKAITTGGASFGTSPNNLTVSGNNVYFTASDGSKNTEVWATDGSTVTRLDPNPNSASDTYINAFELTPFTEASGAAALAFVANVGTAATPVYQLFVTTGTAGSGTKAITTGGASFGTQPLNLTANGPNVYFTATDSSGGVETWVTDGTNVTKLDPNPTSGSDTYTSTYIPSITSYAITAATATAPDALTGLTPYTFTVTRSGTTFYAATLSYSVTGSGSTPAPTSQFANPTGTVTFASGQTVATLTINANGGSVVSDEGFAVTLGAGTGATGAALASIATATASGTVQHNSLPSSFSIAATDADKAAGATGSTPFTFTVTRSGDTSQAASLNLTVQGSGTNPLPASAFPTLTGTVNFAAGASTVVVTVNVNGMLALTKPETFSVTLSSPTATITTPAATGTVEPIAVTYSIAATDANKPDGITGTTPYTFTATRTGDTSQAVTATYSVAGSGATAAPSSLFGATAGSVTFAAGSATASLPVIVASTSIQVAKGFTVTLTPPAGSGASPSTASGTIKPTDDFTAANKATGLIASWASYVVSLAGNAAQTYTGAPLTAPAAGQQAQGVTAAAGGLTYSTNGGNGGIWTEPGGPGNTITTNGPQGSFIASGNGADTINSNAGNNWIATGAGATTINLNGGGSYIASEGADNITANAGRDTVEVSGNATIHGGGANLVVFSDAGSPTITAGTASVTVYGAFGGGSFAGGSAGSNFLVAGTSASTIMGGGSGDVLLGSGGTSTRLIAASGNETLTGQFSSGANIYDAKAANALIVGGAGTNLFNIGSGNASIVGGTGANTFSITNGSAGGTDYISNFNNATDKMHLVGYGANEIGNDLASSHTAGGSQILTLSDGTVLAFLNQTSINASSFA